MTRPRESNSRNNAPDVEDVSFPIAEVLDFDVADLTTDELARLLAKLADDRGRQSRAFALHIGGLLSLGDEDYVAAMRKATVVYADGVSTVILAKVAGALNINRSVTTDLGWAILREFRQLKGRPPRLAAVGGRQGLAEAALKEMALTGLASPVFATHGYHQSWDEVVDQISDARPEIVVVGLGAPMEMKWVNSHSAQLPNALYLTVGGWFGYIVGEEQRAPQLMRDTGFEWLYRLKLQPRRLASRYLRGLLIYPSLLFRVALRRVAGADAVPIARR
jgi:N-acetylglucosaminyldiphosphoundecaprenol N-acetyl-beta-D-mannosaminyltransferase